MKRRDLKKLALMGLTSGMLIATQSAVHAEGEIQPLNEASGAISESELLSQLSSEGQEIYQSLDQEGQLLARLVLGRGCGCSQETQGKLYKGAAHGCGGGKGGCGGLVSDNYDGGNYGGHGCSGNGGYPGGGYAPSHGCSGNGGYAPSHGCSGSVGYAPSHGCSGGHGCSSPGNPSGQPQNPNRSMPQWENQPQYKNQNQNQPAPAGKPTSYNNYQSGRYVAEEQVVDQKVAEPKLTEADLKAKLNADTKKVYESLSPEGKKLALKLANQGCKGQNECKGQNACKSESNATCAGKGGCKGTSAGKFTDKNLAVKVAAMKEQRNNASKNY